MTTILQAIPGTHDIMPAEAATWDRLRETVQQVMATYAYGRIETPCFEAVELFARGVGAHTDIVQKEMYVFSDRGGRELALRPEGTAGVVRAYIEARLDRQRPYAKLWYWGPMFRAERPQKGRYRQFWQFGVEALGLSDPGIDAEQIAVAMRIAGRSGLVDLKLRLNSVGDAQCRPAYRELLRKYFEAAVDRLCDNCRRRLITNPLRILDCKEKGCRAAAAEAPLILDHLCGSCREHLDGVRAGLESLGIAYHLDGRIVRGLDYYQRTAFELESPRLGAQSSLLGGGRYDGLVQQLGGPDLPGVGWAAGVERFLLALAGAPASAAVLDAFVASFPETRAAAFELAERMRQLGIRTELDLLGRSLKSQLKDAARMGATYAVVLGPDEWTRGRVSLRHLDSSAQEELAVDAALSRLGAA